MSLEVLPKELVHHILDYVGNPYVICKNHKFLEFFMNQVKEFVPHERKSSFFSEMQYILNDLYFAGDQEEIKCIFADKGLAFTSKIIKIYKYWTDAKWHQEQFETLVILYNGCLKAIHSKDQCIEFSNVSKQTTAKEKYQQLRKNFLESKDTFSKIELLDLNSKKLRFLLPEIAHLQSLRELRLCNNTLETLPNELLELKFLIGLNLSNNQFKAFPTIICKLLQLKWLTISNNQIKTIPDQIGNLIFLENINLNINKIKVIPDGFKNLKNLKVLNLSDNQIEVIPDFFEELTSLKSYLMQNNPLSKVPCGIYRPGLNFYRDYPSCNIV